MIVFYAPYSVHIAGQATSLLTLSGAVRGEA
jgi:hypothetical protein